MSGRGGRITACGAHHATEVREGGGADNCAGLPSLTHSVHNYIYELIVLWYTHSGRSHLEELGMTRP